MLLLIRDFSAVLWASASRHYPPWWAPPKPITGLAALAAAVQLPKCDCDRLFGNSLLLPVWGCPDLKAGQQLVARICSILTVHPLPPH